jgi:hypothetical protein
MTKSRDLANAATALNAVTATELGYVDGVTSAIQTQLDAKLASSTAATTYQPLASNFSAGKNKILNSDFSIWQRGNSFTANNTYVFTADRWQILSNNTGGNVVVSREAFTPGAAPVAGYEGTYFLRNTATSPTGAVFNVYQHKIEDVRILAGQTATLSFWAKADASRTMYSQFFQNYGSGGSTETYNGTSYSYSLTTSWQRFSTTFTMPSVSSKTIGAGSNLRLEFVLPVNVTSTVDIWGVQLEAGSNATAFQTATGTVQGELAACQRYYQKSYPAGLYPGANFQGGYSTTIIENNIPNNNYFHHQPLIVQTRAEPTITIYSGSGATAKVSTTAGSDLAANSAVPILITDNHFTIQNQSGGALSASGGGFLFYYVASSEL